MFVVVLKNEYMEVIFVAPEEQKGITKAVCGVFALSLICYIAPAEFRKYLIAFGYAAFGVYNFINACKERERINHLREKLGIDVNKINSQLNKNIPPLGHEENSLKSK